MWKPISKLFGTVSALAQETTTTTQSPESGLFGIPWWVVVTIGFITMILAPRLFRRRRRDEPTEPSTEVQNLEQQQQQMKPKSKEERALRRDIIKGLLFFGGVWLVFSPFMAVTLHDLGYNTLLFWIVTGSDLAVCSSVMIHGFVKTLGMRAIRGTEKSVHGGRSKRYNMLLGSTFPLQEAKIKEVLTIYKDSITNPLYQKRLEAAAVATPEATTEDTPEPISPPELPPPPENVDLANQVVINYRSGHEIVQSIVPKECVSFLNRLAPIEVKDIIEATNEMIQRRDPENQFARAKILTNSLRAWMEDDFEDENITKACTFIEVLPQKSNAGNALGGMRLEFCAVKQYDTKHVIWATKEPFQDAFIFSAVDHVDSTYIPLPMPHTDIDWFKIGEIELQLEPGKLELVNVLMPIYTDHSIRKIPHTQLPNPTDKLSRFEMQNAFIEPAAAQLQEEVRDLRTDLQQLKANIARNMRLALDEVKRFYLKLYKARFPGLRANLEMVVIVVLLTALLTGVVVRSLVLASVGGA